MRLSSAPLPDLRRGDLALLRKSIARCAPPSVPSAGPRESSMTWMCFCDSSCFRQVREAAWSRHCHRTSHDLTARAGAAVFACGFNLTRHMQHPVQKKTKPPCAGRGHQEAVVLRIALHGIRNGKCRSLQPDEARFYDLLFASSLRLLQPRRHLDHLGLRRHRMLQARGKADGSTRIRAYDASRWQPTQQARLQPDTHTPEERWGAAQRQLSQRPGSLAGSMTVPLQKEHSSASSLPSQALLRSLVSLPGILSRGPCMRMATRLHLPDRTTRFLHGKGAR